MITFFRRIRQSLLSDQKITRYLVYAIGEILLVVIGILIALQINTWNENRQHRELERISLQNLYEDLVIQEEIITTQLGVESLALARSDSAIQLLNEAKSSTELLRLMNELSSRRTFIANKATFNNLGATGTIVYIRNKELLNSIIRYYQQLDYLATVVNNNNLFIIDSQFGAFVAGNGAGFQADPNGNIQVGLPIDPQRRFTIQSQLINRKQASESIHDISEIQLEATLKLQAEVRAELDK